MRQIDGSARPIQRVVVFWQGRPEADLDPRSDYAVVRARLDHGGRAVAFGLELEPHAAGDHGQEAVRGEHGPSDHAQAIAERAAGRQAQELGGYQRTVDAEQARDFMRIEARAFVLDEISAFDFACRHARLGIERVVGEFFQDQASQQALRDASLLLQALDGAEGGPVLTLEFKILSAV